MTDEAQRDAAQSEQPNLLVVAPPGCGKTELLAMRANFLIDQLLPNQKILALTFSKRARDNLSERMRAHLGDQRFRRFVRVRNFHGHATEIIRAHCRTIHLDPAFLLPTKSMLSRAIRELTADEDAIAATNQALAIVKRQPLSDPEVAEALVSQGNQLAIVVEANRAASSQLHYDDLLRHAQRVLRIDRVAHLYQQHYGAVLVDEFQDLTPQQLDIALRSCIRNRTFAGDPLQGIYSWAGAEPVAVQQELTKICGPALHLTKSYRSSPAVLKVVNSIGVPLGAAPLSSATPERWPDGGFAGSKVFSHGDGEAEWVAASCAEILLHLPQTTIGVLTRSGWRRKLIDAAFAARSDITFRRWDLAVDDAETIERLRNAAAGLPLRASSAELEQKALADLDPKDVDMRSDLLEAIAQITDEVDPNVPLKLAIARYFKETDNRAVDAGVHLLNAHTGKGQQFDWVFLPGLQDGHVPDFRAKTSAQLLEEQRVLLVMLSRAKRGLVVSRATTMTSKRGRPYSPDVCRWWNLLIEAEPPDRSDINEYLRVTELDPLSSKPDVPRYGL